MAFFAVYEGGCAWEELSVCVHEDFEGFFRYFRLVVLVVCLFCPFVQLFGRQLCCHLCAFFES